MGEAAAVWWRFRAHRADGDVGRVIRPVDPDVEKVLVRRPVIDDAGDGGLDLALCALGPNESGIIALTSAADVEAVKEAMPEATKVRSAGVSDKSAKAITEAAKKAS